MSDPGVNQLLNELRARGEVPLAILAYDVEKKRITGYVFADQNTGEVNAILHEIKIRISPVEFK